MTSRLNATKHFLLFAATCVSVLLCISVRAMALDRNTTSTSYHTFDAAEKDELVEPNLLSDRNTMGISHEARMFNPGASTSSRIEETTENLLKAADRSKSVATLNDQVATARRKRVEEGFVSNKKSRVDGKQVDDIRRTLQFAFDKKRSNFLRTVSTMDNDVLILLVAAARQPTDADNFLRNILQKKIETNRISLEYILERLRFNADDKEPLKNPLLNLVVINAPRLNPDLFKVLITKLASVYHPVEDKLSQLLDLAKNDPTTKSIADTVQLHLWKYTKHDIHDVFELLELDTLEIVALLNDPNLRTWFSYVQFRRRNPYNLMILAMKKNVKNKDLAIVQNILDAARNRGGNADILEKLQFELWKLQEKSGEDIFRHLKLDREGEKILESPLWSTWVSYLKYLGGDHDKLMFAILKNNSADNLERLIARAKTAESTKDFAAKLEEYLWFENKLTFDNVFDLLHLKKMGYKIFGSPEFKSWSSYVTKVSQHMENPDEFVVISELEKHFGRDELAKMVKKAIKVAIDDKDESTHDEIKLFAEMWMEKMKMI